MLREPTPIVLTINGESREISVRSIETLAYTLRERLELTGTTTMCNDGSCGSCTILIDGKPVLSCLTLAMEVEGKDILTIEGLAAPDGTLHPLQAAFKQAHGLQCGFCTPGMILSALDLLQTNPKPTDPEIRTWLKGNICRCTGYQNIVKAIELAADEMSGA